MRTTHFKLIAMALLMGACSAPSDSIKNPDPQAPVVAAVAITPPSISLQVGKTLQLQALAHDSAGNAIQGRVVHWSAVDTSIATISASGMLSARMVGSTSIRLTIDGKSADAPATIAAVPVASVSVSPGAPSVQVGATVQFSAVARDLSGNALTGRTIAWSSSNSAVATVTSAGLASAVAAGTSNIVAVADGVSGQATITVSTTAPPPPPPVATVTVTLGSSSLTTGQTTQASAVLKDANGNLLTGRAITWASSNTAVATVNSSGTVSAVGQGSASITATSEGKSGAASVSVTVVPVASVTVTLGSNSLTSGQTTQATAVLKDANGNVLGGRAVTWSSSNTNAATVSANGLVSAVAQGTATITATSEGKSGSANLNVAPNSSTPKIDTIFAESFESGTLAVWDDGVDPTRHHVVTDASLAHTGSHVLEVDYPANDTGGWLTKFFMPGYDSVYVRMYVRFAPDWVGGSKLMLLRGSRTDNQWSAFGVAGKCPVGTDFFATNIMMEGNGDPGTLRFYTYYPEMAREPDGVTCWGRYGDGNEQYLPLMSLPRDSWQELGFWVRLNTPGQHDGYQKFWVNGTLRGVWNNLSYRTSSILKLNSFSIELSSPIASVPRHLWIDDILVTTAPPSP